MNKRNGKNKRFKRKVRTRKSEKHSFTPRSIASLKQWADRHYVSTSINDGDHLEAIIQKICERIGVPDMVSRSPKYMDGRNLKEVADIVIVFDKKIIAFQIKHKNLNANKEDSVIFGRAVGLIDKTIGQFETIIRLFERGSIPNLTNLRGNTINLTEFHNWELICISIVAYPGVEKFPKSKQFDIASSVKNLRSYPVHVFDANDFDKVTLEADTLPDLINYLKVRRSILEDHLIGSMVEVDFLAVYKTKSKDLSQISNPKEKVSILPGAWEEYVTNFKEYIAWRNILNTPSYAVDEILANSHRTIGYVRKDVKIESHIPPGSVDAHFYFANELCKLNRMQRRAVGQALIDCANRAEVNHRAKEISFAFRLIMHDGTNERLTLVLSVVDRAHSLKDRTTMLENICMAAFYRMRPSSLLGIAIDSSNSWERGEDFYCIEQVSFTEEGEKEYEKIANRYFGPLREIVTTEYGDEPNSSRS